MQIKQELKRREIQFGDSEKACELKAKLMKSLKSINRNLNKLWVLVDHIR